MYSCVGCSEDAVAVCWRCVGRRRRGVLLYAAAALVVVPLLLKVSGVDGVRVAVVRAAAQDGLESEPKQKEGPMTNMGQSSVGSG